MLTRLDHLVILVRELDRAVRDYGNLGFTVTPGGEHADGATGISRMGFASGSYGGARCMGAKVVRAAR